MQKRLKHYVVYKTSSQSLLNTGGKVLIGLKTEPCVYKEF